MDYFRNIHTPAGQLPRLKEGENEAEWIVNLTTKVRAYLQPSFSHPKYQPFCRAQQNLRCRPGLHLGLGSWAKLGTATLGRFMAGQAQSTLC